MPPRPTSVSAPGEDVEEIVGTSVGMWLVFGGLRKVLAWHLKLAQSSTRPEPWTTMARAMTNKPGVGSRALVARSVDCIHDAVHAS